MEVSVDSNTVMVSFSDDTLSEALSADNGGRKSPEEPRRPMEGVQSFEINTGMMSFRNDALLSEALFADNGPEESRKPWEGVQSFETRLVASDTGVIEGEIECADDLEWLMTVYSQA